MLAAGSGNHRAQQPLMNNDQPMLIEPAARESEQPLPIIRARELPTQYANQRAPVITGEPLESKRIGLRREVFFGSSLTDRCGRFLHESSHGA